jgi:hypothetical protein
MTLAAGAALQTMRRKQQFSVSSKTIINRDHDIEASLFIRHPARSEAQSQDPESTKKWILRLRLTARAE